MKCAGCGKDVPEKFIQSQILEDRVFCKAKCVFMYYNRRIDKRMEAYKNE